MKKYNLPIEVTTLAHYLSRACIVPMVFLGKSQYDKIQSNNSNALLLTTHNGVQGCNCYIVVQLMDTEVEKNGIPLSNDFLWYKGALPISRIDEIVFNNKEQRDTTITNIEMGNAFVDRKKISIDAHFEPIEIPTQLTTQPIEKDSTLSDKLKEYNRVMGALMFMRLAKENQTATYSDNFLQTIGLYSPYLKFQLEKLNIDIHSKFENFFEADFVEFRNILQQYISKDVVEKYMHTHKCSIKIDPINGYDFQTIYTLKNKQENSNNQEILNILALLQNFNVKDGEGGFDKIDDLILNGFYHKQFIKKGKAEVFAFYYGYNRGYDKFRNQYKLDDKCIEVKFRFDSIFERCIAESVFQYIVCDNHTPEMTYLQLEDYPSEVVQKDDVQNEVRILDENILIIKKNEPTNNANQYGQESNKDYSSNMAEKCLRHIRVLLNWHSKTKLQELAGRMGMKNARKENNKENIIDFLLKQNIDDMVQKIVELSQTNTQQVSHSRKSKTVTREQELPLEK